MGAERVLVVGPAWVGDMVMAQSLYRYLKEARPAVEIDVLAPDWSLPLLERMPEVAQGVRMPLGHGELGLPVRFRLGRSLRERHYDQAIVLPRSLKAALVPFFAGARRRTGYQGEMRYGLINDMRQLDREALPMVVQRYINLGRVTTKPERVPDIPNPQLRVDEANATALFERFGLDGNRPAVAFAPGAEYGLAKQWPPEYFASLARRLAERGVQVWVVGSDKDRAVGETIVGASEGAVLNLCGKTSLTDVVDLLSLAQVMVTNDSGLMHIGAAVGTEIVALYGSSSPNYTPPLTRRKVVFFRELECSPCFERTCPYGHTRCLGEIKPSMVLEKIQEIIDSMKELS
ncbi:lipopolysaccharide heptosyltransferase II [Thiohalomonas denitrificans]|uniref:lipopolysaccharide heptosyltransferase II n=1 Tax=Thiohalomonas denitrificans TaxID=415747 RepID=UPI0026EC47BE|nr:lipopolysaccharide heptosyltransferase II [Thiohalomonas denitrificans]